MSKYVDRPRFGCALAGALGVLRAIPRAIPIVHASTGCAYNVYNGTNAGAAYLGGGYCGATSIPSSNVLEKEIVFGGEQRLQEQIETTLEIMDGDLYVVVTGCMVEMVGDDAESVVKEFADDLHPVIAVSTASFKGNSYYGYDVLLEGLVKQYVIEQKGKDPKKVNILGIVPGQDVLWKGNLKEIKRVLQLIGIKANTFFGEGETLNEIRNSADASLNIILSDVYGALTAEAYAQIHHIPAVRTALPVGYLQTEKFLRKIGQYFKIDESVIERALEFEKDTYFDYVERIADIYNDVDFQRYGIVVSDANYAPAVSEFISDELGWVPQLTVITDFLTEQQKDKLKNRFENYESGLKPNVKFDTDASSVRRYVRENWEPDSNQRYYDALDPGIILGSVFEKELSAEFKYPLVTISFPITNRVIMNRAYAGFNGGITLMEDIFTTLVAGR
ncbi:nitrogenase component 1 [Anaerosinus massiliensis]|uniref:nitrogenase component 1 n=1 Tax=Massilibacillus massiliensis TaxID=1806837 RepID=UPI000A99CDF7|nr:nitrogenase component 1 [Massilibacillus massiliensis]